MGIPSKHRRNKAARPRFSIFTFLLMLLLLSIIGGALLILGSFKIIHLPETLNAVSITTIIPLLSCIIPLGQWLHSISTDKKEVQSNTHEQIVKLPVSNIAVAALNPPGISETQMADHEKATTINLVPPDEGERVDMGEAPYVEHFYGRVAELATLKRWIVDEHCRLVSIIGVGGIGKTSLVARLIDQELHDFRVVFWRSLLNAPPIERILQECLQFLTRTQQIEIPQDTAEQMRLLVAQLQKRRCLLVLDNADTILKSGSSTAEYKDGYEGYGKLVRLLGESRHQSCLLVTSREQLKEIAWLEGEGTSVHTYRLGGLQVEDARVILQRKGLSGEENSWQTLIARFSGNPMMLIIASPAIRESYRGHISQYLVEFSDVPLNEYPDLRVLLDGQFARLSPLEQQIIYWLAIEREAVSLQDLRENSVQPVSKLSMLTAIEALQRRSWIEQSGSGRFTLQPAMMDAVTERFNELVVQEINAGKPELFASHALMKAQAKDYIRASQFQLILNVIAQNLFSTLGRNKLEEKFQQRLDALRKLPEQPNNYEAGNILNLLVQTGYDLRSADFSHLVVRQAYLQEAELLDVNFAHANLATSVFTDTFGSILSVALSPHGDLLTAGTMTGEIRLWHAASGRPLQTFQGHTDWVPSVAFSPDGKLLASGSEDHAVRLWDVSSGQCLKTLYGSASAVLSVAFSPDGKTLASGGYDHIVRLWDVSSGQCLKIFQGHTNIVWSVAFTSNGSMLASVSEDQTICLWDVSSGQRLNTLHGHTSTVRSVAFHPDGKLLASGSEDQTVCLWDVSSGQRLNTLHGHTSAVRSTVFNLDGKLLATSSEDQTVRLWNVDSNQCLNTLHGHTNEVWSVAFHPDGKTLVSGSLDQTVRLWDAHHGQCLNTLHGHTNGVYAVNFSPDGKHLAYGSLDQTVRLWDVHHGQCLNTLHGHTNGVYTVDFSPLDGKLLASGSLDQMVRLWDVSSGQCLNILHGHTSTVWAVAFHPDGKLLASGSYDKTIRLWDVSSGQCLNILHNHASAVWAVVFSPDGKLLASGNEDQTIRLWDVSSGQCLNTLHGHTAVVYAVVFSPDGKLLASGSYDKTIRLWDASSGQCLNTLHGHANAVFAVDFSLDGRLLASGSDDQTARLWDVSSGQCLNTLYGHSHWVTSVALSPDGQNLTSGSYDGTINLWDWQTGEYLRTLRSDRPYERMNITQVQGLTEAQKATLRLLGAVEET